MIRIFLVDDHQMFLDGIKSFLKNESDVEILGEALNGNLAIEKLNQYDYINKHEIDIVVLDIEMPELNGFETAKYIKKKFPHIKILVLTMHDKKEYILQMMKIGVDGYILKDQSKGELLMAIRNIYNDRPYFGLNILQTVSSVSSSRIDFQEASSILTSREIDVLTLIGEGYSSREIAERLFISLETVNTHRKNLLSKLELPNSYHLVRYAIKSGLVS